jgi:hypothetical protein
MIKDFMNRLMGKKTSKEGPDLGSEKRIPPESARH